jgi:hypothetical protein
MGERLGFARSGSCRYQQWRRRSLFRANAIASSMPLRRVQPFQDRVDGGSTAGIVLFLFRG